MATWFLDDTMILFGLKITTIVKMFDFTRSVLLSWTPPTTHNHAPLTQYTIQAKEV